MKLLNFIRRGLLKIIAEKPLLFETFENYNKAAKNGEGYSEDILVKVIVEKAKKYKENLNIKNEVDLISLRSFFAISFILQKNTINILDFGGGAGTHYFLLKKFFGEKTKINWHVVETQLMVNESKKNNLESKELKFFSNIDSAIKDIDKFDLVYANSSLPYTDKPLMYLEKLLKVNSDFLYFTRTPLSEYGKENIVGLQISKLSANGEGTIPEELNIEDRLIKYPFTAMAKENVENIINKYGDIELIINEEKNSYPTKKGNLNNFGYIVKKR